MKKKIGIILEKTNGNLYFIEELQLIQQEIYLI